MVGSSSTSLSEMLSKKIDISPPDAFLLDLSTDNLFEHFSQYTDLLIKISFRMVIGDLIDSEIMQLMPVEFAKEIVKGLFNDMTTPSSSPVIETKSFDTSVKTKTIEQDRGMSKEREYSFEGNSYDNERKVTQATQEEKVNIRPVQFQSFDEPSIRGSIPENIALIQDVPLKITVELGRTVKKISEILEFSPGTIIELDKLVGEPLDILVNGQYVANGEVVVIDENYGIRVTDIVNPSKRISKI